MFTGLFDLDKPSQYSIELIIDDLTSNAVSNYSVFNPSGLSKSKKIIVKFFNGEVKLFAKVSNATR